MDKNIIRMSVHTVVHVNVRTKQTARLLKLPCDKLQDAYSNSEHGDNGERLIMEMR